MQTLANAIIAQDINAVRGYLRYGGLVNQLDEYGFTPLIEGVIAENVSIVQLLLENNANPNQQDTTGGTPLYWAVEKNNIELTELLLAHHANPNACNFAGQPVLSIPTLRRQRNMRKILVDAGADEVFAQDYIHTKLLGHLFELVGFASIIDPQNKYVDVDFEGFFLEVTLGLVADALMQFQNHFAARQFRRYENIANFIVNVLQRGLMLIQYQKYYATIDQYAAEIDPLVSQSPVLIPVGYEGHAITFISYEDIWIKCDRREDSRLYDNVMFYRVKNRKALTRAFFKHLIYVKQSSEFINHELDQLLDLEPLTELKVEAQISGNCSWANVEAVIPALFYLVFRHSSEASAEDSSYKSLALNYFHRWREWNKERALQYCIRRFQESDPLRKACQAEILAAILFQRLKPENRSDQDDIELILSLLIGSPYEYILRNYVKVFYFEKQREDGKAFFNLLKNHGVRFN